MSDINTIFGPETRQPDELLSSPGQHLTLEIAQLCASLGITTESGARSPYKPDAFVQAVKAQHDKLMVIKAKLTALNEQQNRREEELKRRETEVQFREERIAAHEQLAGLEAPRKRWFSFAS